jgi:hypothetical protein
LLLTFAVSDCAGSGLETGNRLGFQFCAIAQQAAFAPAPESETQIICNAVESTSCYTAFDDYINQNCPGLRDQNMDFYTELSNVCMITQ